MQVFGGSIGWSILTVVDGVIVVGLIAASAIAFWPRRRGRHA